MPILKEKLIRKEKRLISKIKSPKAYKIISAFVFVLFWFKKKYFSFSRKKTKSEWMISITSDKILWTKLSYIDDLIVSKKSRWRGLWKILFKKALDKAEKEEKSDYIFLVTNKDRKASHNIYKKFWFSLVAMWVWYLAYKKRNKK